MMLLENKVAVVYGAGGAIGRVVARAFACEGARLFLAGRHLASVEAAAGDIAAGGAAADAAEVDALDESAVDAHMQSVADRAGRIDIAFNTIGITGNGIFGVPLLEMRAEAFALPMTTYAMAYFLMARLAARRMVANKAGVIMTVTTQHARMGLPLSGGLGLAMAAEEALTRALSAELAPQGIRVVGLRPQAIPETATLQKAFEARSKVSGISWEQFQEGLAGKTHPRRLMTLDEVAGMAVFMASDKASGMTGTTVNLTMGSLDD